MAPIRSSRQGVARDEGSRIRLLKRATLNKRQNPKRAPSLCPLNSLVSEKPINQKLSFEIFCAKLSEKSRTHLQRSLTGHPNGTFRLVLASIYPPNLRCASSKICVGAACSSGMSAL